MTVLSRTGHLEREVVQLPVLVLRRLAQMCHRRVLLEVVSHHEHADRQPDLRPVLERELQVPCPLIG